MNTLRLLANNVTRLLHLMGVVLRHAVAYVLGERARRWPWLAKRLPPARLTGPERLRTLFEDLGGTFVKFGQMLALQPDIVSLEYCNALFKLLDRVEPFGFEDVERTFREEHGRGPEEIFDRIEREPLATASVGQVHVAWLDGEKVAVKVQRPSVEYEFGSDIRLMVAMIATIKALRLGFLSWLLEPTTEFVAWTREELDFRCEARYTEQLRHFARDNPVQTVPKVWSEYTSRRT
ncbi:MAG: AarF/UbiB family protein, partial [Acidobacteriota bacterium]